MDNNTRELKYFFEDVENNDPLFEVEGSLDQIKYGLTVMRVILIPAYIALVCHIVYSYLIAQIYNGLYNLTNPLRYWINSRN